MPRIKESDLLLPALYIVGTETNANTTKIKQILIEVFRPEGEDNQLLAGRNDTKFTQIVRNLLGSHYSTNGMSVYTKKDSSGMFTLSEEGQALVDNNIEYLKYLFANRFGYEDAIHFSNRVISSRGKKHRLYVYAENDEVMEGKAAIKQSKVKERSKKLRDAAIRHYTHDGRITCAVCEFDFESFYGEIGRQYIQMHHEKPICQYSDEGFSQYIREAVKYMKPVCANCHCMIHRNNRQPLSIEKLKTIVDENRTSRC